MRKKSISDDTQALSIQRIQPDPRAGLTDAQIQERVEHGYTNCSVNPPSKSVGQIILSNVFTFFNLLYFFLAACILFVGSYQNLMFMVIILANMGIGIFQELRAKKTIDKLTLLSAPKATVIRNHEEQEVSTEDLVLDDIVIFSAGNQICADAIVLEGEVQVNESLITGESNEITKRQGDPLFSGSFIISGKCCAQLDKVGAESFAAKLTIEAKKAKKRKKSEMMKSLTRLIQIIGILIIPIGALLFFQQYRTLQLTMEQSVVSTVAALLGMIPEGLYLLTSVALAVSVIRLARHKTLVHEMGCIETLARVDVLCVDKTGTITEPQMQVVDTISLQPEQYTDGEIQKLLGGFVSSMDGDNSTMQALKAHFHMPAYRTPTHISPFSSSLKYSGVSYGDASYVIGAPEFILHGSYESLRPQIEDYSLQGNRVLLFAKYEGPLDGGPLCRPVTPIALVLLANQIRKEAPETFQYFARQGVAIKVISGDNPLTVSQIATQAGIDNADRFVDASTLTTKEAIFQAADQYTVFGRVTPDQKRMLVQALKKSGHTVAMTGDGVNDVLALKDADCSIAMASGSDAACHVSQLVLLDSNFASMPHVVMEGRRVVNNIERAASLFLVKNIFSFLLAIITLFAALPYPVTPVQLSLVSSLTIGVPSFFLALEPNKNIVKGHFLRNVLH
ncbi:MAG: cation-translocating P-type ATPase, partial [Clostridia bacterium]